MRTDPKEDNLDCPLDDGSANQASALDHASPLFRCIGPCEKGEELITLDNFEMTLNQREINLRGSDNFPEGDAE